ncbi:unnamed protein product [Linum tenue]|uniref:GTD-binding domain-containing protein n=1 Tax=Linum tenue TaxID=586396 RepID=A0AAV0QWE4_9ROSI|nr:unnamed protein product [Linum tenue]
METKVPTTKRTLRGYVEQELGKWPHFIVYAVLEWFLILVLFVDGFLAFFANEYAKLFDLRLPCLFCTRIDHAFRHRSHDFYYNDSICDSHRKKVSSLAYCHIHKRLSDIRKMCEGCLLSFATEKESGSDTYKSLVGILHKDVELFFEDDEVQLPKQPNDVVMAAAQAHHSLHRCSCCGGPLKGGKPKGKNAGFSQAPTPSPRALPPPTVAPLRHLELPPSTRFDAENNNSNMMDEMGEELMRTPSFIRGNKFFGIPLTDSATTTPRWAIRCPPKKSALDRGSDFSAEEGGGGTGDQSAPTEPEGGDPRQVRLDRKSLMELYMELDEERNASAVAANNAMAMITRLQAEKAAVQMEALQYQRMMEEQAEYDEEAIQLLRDDLKKKDRQVKYLENEIEAYKIRYGDIMEDGFVVDEVDEDDDDDGAYQEVEASEYGTPSYGGMGSNTSREESSGKNQIENAGEGGSVRPNKFGGLRRLKQLEIESSDDETEQESRMKDLSHLRARVRALEEEDDFFRDDDVTVGGGVGNGSEKGKLISGESA